MKKIYLSPSDQVRNTYATGNTTESIQCRRIADAAQAALERCGFAVKNNQQDDMYSRVSQSNSWAADLHICIHTNAFDGKVMGTRAFSWNTSGDGYRATKAIYDRVAPITPGTSESIRAYPELYEIKYTTAPCAYIEVEFHDTVKGAEWIISHTKEAGEAIAHGVCDYFGVTYKPADTPTPAPTPDPTPAGTSCTVTLPVLKKGAYSGYVKTAQLLLNAYFNAGLAVDGGFGAKTEDAVVKYQRNRGLSVTGCVDAKTWLQLLC